MHGSEGGEGQPFPTPINLPYSILLKIPDFLKICFDIQNRIKLFRVAGSGA
jgi:hypothetical protein